MLEDKDGAVNGDLRIQRLLEEAIQPSEADILRARSLILQRLASGREESVERLVELVYRDGNPGLGQQPLHDAYVDLGPVQLDPAARFDREDILLRQQRLRSAVHEALAQLSAEGLLLPADPSGSEVQVSIGKFTGGSGWRGSERVTTHRPMVATGYKLSARWATSPAVTEISMILDADGLEPLLNKRGMRCWHEAVAAFSRGLYLAAAGMIGAASEAAWYSLGEAISDEQRLTKPLEEDNTVQVIQLVAERLRQAPRSKATVTELQAHAAHLRDLRNYGLHPRPDEDAPREAAFTEAGCLALLMQSRRYLARLLDLARSAEILDVKTHRT